MYDFKNEIKFFDKIGCRLYQIIDKIKLFYRYEKIAHSVGFFKSYDYNKIAVSVKTTQSQFNNVIT
jgi:hypothetical protein